MRNRIKIIHNDKHKYSTQYNTTLSFYNNILENKIKPENGGVIYRFKLKFISQPNSN